MIVFKCVIHTNKPDTLFLIQLDTSEMLLNPSLVKQSDTDTTQFMHYSCSYAKVLKIFECASQCQIVSNKNSDDLTMHKELQQWLVVPTNKQTYKINKIIHNICVCTNPAAAIERKWKPTMTTLGTTGPYIRRLFTGQILLHGYYKFGFRDGPWLYFDENGELTHKIEYDWLIELALDEAFKEKNTQTVVQLMYDNWETCFGRIPGMEQLLRDFFHIGSTSSSLASSSSTVPSGK